MSPNWAFGDALFYCNKTLVLKFFWNQLYIGKCIYLAESLLIKEKVDGKSLLMKLMNLVFSVQVWLFWHKFGFFRSFNLS